MQLGFLEKVPVSRGRVRAWALPHDRGHDVSSSYAACLVVVDAAVSYAFGLILRSRSGVRVCCSGSPTGTLPRRRWPGRRVLLHQ